jgi:polysaccharide biosynthesis transport protein
VQRVGRTYVLEVAYRSLDKNKAAAIANELSEAYILDQLKANFDATKRASDWLEGRLTELRDDVERSDRAVQDYKAKYNLVDAGNGRTLTDQQLGDLTTQLVQARAQVAEAKARLDRISGVDFTEGADTSVSDAINNPVILKVREQYLENTRRAADFAARYGESHAAVVNLRKENEQLRLAGRDELRRIAEAYRSDYEIAKSRLESLEASLNNIIEAANSDKQAGVSLRTLESSAQSYRRLYDSFLQRFADSTQQQSFPKTEARVITPATRGEKSDPNTLLVLGAAAMAGLMGGVGIAFAREQLDRVLKTSRQVEDDLGVECLGILPRIESKETRQMARELAPAASNQRGPRSLPVELGLLRYVTRAPLSRFAETIRRVKVAAGTTASPDDSVVLGVVSALPGEGKSTVAANLAQLLNSAGNRALLIDADLRHPSLTKHLTPNARAGLVELLNSSVTLDDVVWKDPVTEVDFLPAVLDRPIPHSAELLSSGAMARLLEVLRTRYKYIVLDFPPLAPVVDASAASEFVDKFLLVIEWGQTLPATVADSLASADLIQARMLGAVLNKADLAALKRLEPYNTKGYYNYYYEE